MTDTHQHFTHAGTLTKAQHRYTLDTPVLYLPLGEQPSIVTRQTIVSVSVFLNTWHDEPRPTTLVASTSLGRSIVASTGTAGPNDDPRLLEMFADLIDDAEQRGRPAVEVLPHLGATRDEQPRPAAVTFAQAAEQALTGLRSATAAAAEQPDAHYCQHVNRVHACTCAGTTSHSSRLCVLTAPPA